MKFKIVWNKENDPFTYLKVKLRKLFGYLEWQVLEQFTRNWLQNDGIWTKKPFFGSSKVLKIN